MKKKKCMISDIIQFVQTRTVGLVIAILVFSLLSSRQIIIYNEEILVAFNFFAFVWFTAHYYGDQIQEMLDQRSREVASGLQNYVKARSEFLVLCKQEYNKQLSFADQIHNLGSFSSQEILDAARQGDVRFHQIVPALVFPKLNYLAVYQVTRQNALQQQRAFYLSSRILENYRSASSTVRHHLVVQSIRKLDALENA